MAKVWNPKPVERKLNTRWDGPEPSRLGDPTPASLSGWRGNAERSRLLPRWGNRLFIRTGDLSWTQQLSHKRKASDRATTVTSCSVCPFTDGRVGAWICPNCLGSDDHPRTAGDKFGFDSRPAGSETTATREWPTPTTVQPALSLLTYTCHQLQSLMHMVDADTSDPRSGGEMGLLISASQHTLRRIGIRPRPTFSL